MCTMSSFHRMTRRNVCVGSTIFLIKQISSSSDRNENAWCYQSDDRVKRKCTFSKKARTRHASLKDFGEPLEGSTLLRIKVLEHITPTSHYTLINTWIYITTLHFTINSQIHALNMCLLCICHRGRERKVS